MNQNLASSNYNDATVQDLELWEKFRQGDREAYQQLYGKYLSYLYNYGYKIIPDRDVVTDSLQELFIDLWKYKESLSQVGNVKHYLFRSLKNKIVKEKQNNRYKILDMEREYGNALMVLPFEHKVIETQIQADNEKKLKKAFHALSRRQREAVNLLFYEKFSYEEVAGIMGINLRSVYTLTWKALSILRKELSGLIGAFLATFFSC